MALDLDLILEEARAISAVVERARNLVEAAKAAKTNRAELVDTLSRLLLTVARDLAVVASEAQLSVHVSPPP